ncbi:MAG: metallophosphoesterase [Thermoplasmata archaeon]
MQSDLRDHLVAYFEEHRTLVEAGALQLLLSERQPLVLSQEILERLDPGAPFVTRELVESVLAAHRTAVGSPGRGAVSRLDPPSGRWPPDPGATDLPVFQLIREGFSEPPKQHLPLQAYGDLFRHRFAALSRLLKGRPDLPNQRPIAGLRHTPEATSVVGMVRTVRETPQKHHLIVTVEDDTGAIDLFVPKDSPGAMLPFLPDEVVGFKLKFSRDPERIPRVESVERPDVPARRSVHRSPTARRTLFLSDLHIGSKTFLADEWGRLTDFLHGQGPGGEFAGTIDQIVVAGDLVDGIGIYPHQERDLAIADVSEQYQELGRRLRELPERTTIIVVPGNHDAVGPAEPQPALSPALRAGLPSNVRALANPSTFSLSGVVVEAYHGRSLDDLIPAIPGASYARPTAVMKRMLQMRHLAPIYGGRTPLLPSARDGLIVDPLPDLLVTGHAHTYGVDQYRGVLLLSTSTWQAETEYQRMRNITPVPARGALVDLSTMELHTLDFSRPTTTVVRGAG